MSASGDRYRRGIEKEILKNVFEPFFTTKEPARAVGLGLSMVQRLR